MATETSKCGQIGDRGGVQRSLHNSGPSTTQNMHSTGKNRDQGNGGSASESNRPTTLFAPYLGFEAQEVHQEPIHSRGIAPTNRTGRPVCRRIIAESDRRFKSPRQVPLDCYRAPKSSVSTPLSSLKSAQKPPSERESWLRLPRLARGATHQARQIHGLHDPVKSTEARFRRSSIDEPDW